MINPINKATNNTITALTEKYKNCKTVEKQIFLFTKYANNQALLSMKLKNKYEAKIFCREAYFVMDTVIARLINENYIYESKILGQIYNSADEQMQIMFDYFNLSDKDIKWVQTGK